jgi:hypothetical protein
LISSGISIQLVIAVKNMKLSSTDVRWEIRFKQVTDDRTECRQADGER